MEYLKAFELFLYYKFRRGKKITYRWLRMNNINKLRVSRETVNEKWFKFHPREAMDFLPRFFDGRAEKAAVGWKNRAVVGTV